MQTMTALMSEGVMELSKPQIAVQRLHTQRLTQPTFVSPAEVVRWFGAVQAQEYPASLWALALRLPPTTEATIEDAIADGSILRTWPMRGTVHFLPSEDARWMVNLLAPRVMQKMRGMHAKVGLDEEIFAQGRAVFQQALRDGQPVRRIDLYARLREAGIDTRNLRGVFIASKLAHDGLICMGPRIGKQPSFVLLDAWAPQQRDLRGEEAVAELARRYFRSHGPATMHDFCWWTGLKVSEARTAMQALGGELDNEMVDGKTYWWAADYAPISSGSGVYVLPPFDEYLVSYTDRSASLDPTMQVDWPRFDAIGSYVIVSDGQVVGHWQRRLKPNAVEVEYTTFRPLSADEQAGFEEAIGRFGDFLGLPVVFA